ncbi:putative WRKY transcription factor 59 isoform X1 [Canna indica]|uniref:WRKY transcription factor 59 isoform X1 n=1 Tax=Canna indica TaxID=4628 RepID=A0AAQ3L7T5_9LILI|nr:putative WRKY transcription factor 59 isoform X1 [Canna indica]
MHASSVPPINLETLAEAIDHLNSDEMDNLQMENKQAIVKCVIREIEEALNLTMKLQSLVELGDQYSEAQKESARILSEEVLQSCRATLSLLKANNVKLEKECKLEFPSPSSCAMTNATEDPDAVFADPSLDEEDRRRNKFSDSYTWEDITATPFNDGYEWRKYGEKKINGFSFPRSYYRCTYSKDIQRCKAMKQVQQQKGGFPSLYLVTYKGQHTCHCNNIQTTQHLRLPFLPSNSCLPSTHPSLLSFSSDSKASNFETGYDDLLYTPINTCNVNMTERRKQTTYGRAAAAAAAAAASSSSSSFTSKLDNVQLHHPSSSATHTADCDGDNVSGEILSPATF